ncbi:hypothetical protein AAFF_G00428920 [Aldrovandia affinis]|uniref:Uncharacterized protein n=1 Tax=Aldrovandia affinis TaxID=143900 RepID=A0AAD7WIM3_9TELE|nr:hypothetical protein AAFF_G00428920 [Aldrovandia affinis]
MGFCSGRGSAALSCCKQWRSCQNLPPLLHSRDAYKYERLGSPAARVRAATCARVPKSVSHHHRHRTSHRIASHRVRDAFTALPQESRSQRTRLYPLFLSLESTAASSGALSSRTSHRCIKRNSRLCLPARAGSTRHAREEEEVNPRSRLRSTPAPSWPPAAEEQGPVRQTPAFIGSSHLLPRRESVHIFMRLDKPAGGRSKPLGSKTGRCTFVRLRCDPAAGQVDVLTDVPVRAL